MCVTFYVLKLYLFLEIFSFICFLFESYFAWLRSLWCCYILFSQCIWFHIDFDVLCVSICYFFIIDSIFQILSTLKQFRPCETLHNLFFCIDDIIGVVVVIFLVLVFWVITLSLLPKLLWFFFISIMLIFVLLFFLTFIIWRDDLLILSTIYFWSVLSAGCSNIFLYVLKELLFVCNLFFLCTCCGTMLPVAVIFRSFHYFVYGDWYFWSLLCLF